MWRKRKTKHFFCITFFRWFSLSGFIHTYTTNMKKKQKTKTKNKSKKNKKQQHKTKKQNKLKHKKKQQINSYFHNQHNKFIVRIEYRWDLNSHLKQMMKNCSVGDCVIRQPDLPHKGNIKYVQKFPVPIIIPNGGALFAEFAHSISYLQ